MRTFEVIEYTYGTECTVYIGNDYSEAITAWEAYCTTADERTAYFLIDNTGRIIKE